MKDAKQDFQELKELFTKLDSRLKYLEVRVNEDGLVFGHFSQQLSNFKEDLTQKQKVGEEIQQSLCQFNLKIMATSARYAKNKQLL
mmetsp:Transcript_41131/g.39649  ORF Transcript_41131/g.39649 Transcript_41131/m.39649 type:complete len:86 (-) Transcript_41131:408-665(-)